MQQERASEREPRPLIAAIATAPGPAGLGVVRLSGERALATARRRLRDLPEQLLARRLYRGLLCDQAGEPLDDVLVVHFPAPRSYTGEEVVEIHCHGGPALLKAALGAVLSAGAELARAGEFTRRAVASGRMDLLEAEALAALIEADEEDALAGARHALREVAPALRALREKATRALAEAQGSHEHPLETWGESLAWPQAAGRLAAEAAALAGAEPLEARALSGTRVVLIGPPNAGKSSLLNALAGAELALVDAAPGTTRDVVAAPVCWQGHRFTLYDSAGIRNATGVEAAGVARALTEASRADVAVWIEDQSAPPASPPPGVAIGLRVLAKCDLPPHPSRAGDGRRVSAISGEGLAALREELARQVRPEAAAISARQQELLAAAAAHLAAVVGEGPEDLRVAELRLAVRALDALCGVGSGAAEAEALVFQRFCIGK